MPYKENNSLFVKCVLYTFAFETIRYIIISIIVFILQPTKYIVKSELISIDEVVAMGKLMGYLFAGLCFFGIVISIYRNRKKVLKIGKRFSPELFVDWHSVLYFIIYSSSTQSSISL